MARPRVSILLLTYNGADTLLPVLDAISRQQAPFDVEIVAVDSGSTDGTLEMLDRRVTRLLQIPPEDFNHAATRNLGIAATTGALVVLLVQDAVPAGDTWLVRLVEPMVADETLAGTFARQRPRVDASALTRHYLARWPGASETPRTSTLLGAAELEALAPMERYRRCVFDNVCSCIRRTVWEQHPFPPTDIAEDVEWARSVLLAGHRLAYVPDAVVVHSHDRSARYELGRTYLVHRRLRALFGLRTVPSLLALARAIASSLALHLRLLMGARVTSPSQIARAVALAFAFPLGQYLGGVAADTGWTLLRPRGI